LSFFWYILLCLLSTLLGHREVIMEVSRGTSVLQSPTAISDSSGENACLSPEALDKKNVRNFRGILGKFLKTLIH
jgi:hypothetical protein